MRTVLALASLLALAATATSPGSHADTIHIDVAVRIACHQFEPGTLHIHWTEASPAVAQLSMGGQEVSTAITVQSAEHSEVGLVSETQGNDSVLRQLNLRHYTLEFPAATCSKSSM